MKEALSQAAFSSRTNGKQSASASSADPFEKISYWFFKGRLRKKLASLYELEDPWSSQGLAEFFAPWIRAQMEKLPPALRAAPVLDAGGGEGHFYFPLRDLIREYHLVDIEAKALARAREKLPPAARLIHQSLDAFYPAPETYGVIWLFNILTYLGHARHPRIFAGIQNSLAQSLKRGGLILLIHAYYSETELDKMRVLCEPFPHLGFISNLFEYKELGNQKFFLQTLLKI